MSTVLNSIGRKIGNVVSERTAAEVSAGVTIVDYSYPTLDARRYGTNDTPGTTDTYTALQAAINVAIANGGGEILLSGGPWRTNTTLEVSGSINGIHFRGDGAEAAVIRNGVVGSGVGPALLIEADGAYFNLTGLTIEGNGLTGASGNGHGLALINPGVTLAPQVVSLVNVTVKNCNGTGLDDAAGSIPACGIYAYDSTSFSFFNLCVTGCQMGVRMDTMEDVSFHGGLIDDCDDNCIYLDNCHAISFHGGVFQNSGAGGSTDGIVYLATCESVSFFGGELKNGDPYLVNAATTDVYSHNVTFESVDLMQLDDTMGTTAIYVNNGVMNLNLLHCQFLFVNTMTTAKGVEVVQAASGYSMTGLRVVGNGFRIGAGGTIVACVHLNVGTNRIYAPLIESNSFGFQTSIGSATTFTDAILLEGRVESGVIRANSFITTTNLTITDAIHINSANVLALRVENNEYSGFGTITNQVNNSAGVAFVREERQYVYKNSGTGSIASGATAATITHGLSFTPARADITVTLGENPTNTPGAVWVDTITSTQFNVNCENDPGASNLDFSWKASA